MNIMRYEGQKDVALKARAFPPPLIRGLILCLGDGLGHQDVENSSVRFRIINRRICR
jgi:hypothetical protein